MTMNPPVTALENREKLKSLLVDVMLISADEFRFDLKREDLDTWDSLGVVSLAVGIEETFGYHPTQEETQAIRGVEDIVRLLRSKGIAIDD
jgi:acyl carrier protein